MKIRIAPGIEATVVSDAEAEKCDVRVCALWDSPAYFDGDARATCAGCGVALRVRPYGPHRPMKLCVACVQAWAGRH